MIWRETWGDQARAFQAADLKICDLCGALNLASNGECFVCRWRGHFDCRPEVVTLAMELLERQHGRIELPLISDRVTLGPLQRPSLRWRVGAFFTRVRHWFFGKEPELPSLGGG
jgi:hypothetical protein